MDRAAATRPRRGSSRPDRVKISVVIHVLTVHYQSDRWIDPQLRYLASNLDRPYRVVADLEGIANAPRGASMWSPICRPKLAARLPIPGS
jgi:hypothetical protein